jgi:hypothetical protein
MFSPPLLAVTICQKSFSLSLWAEPCAHLTLGFLVFLSLACRGGEGRGEGVFVFQNLMVPLEDKTYHKAKAGTRLFALKVAETFACYFLEEMKGSEEKLFFPDKHESGENDRPKKHPAEACGGGTYVYPFDENGGKADHGGPHR